MPADPNTVRTAGGYVSRGGSILTAAAPFAAAASGPAGIAFSVIGGLASLVGDLMQQRPDTIVEAQDPGDMLDAMHAHWAARKAGGK